MPCFAKHVGFQDIPDKQKVVWHKGLRMIRWPVSLIWRMCCRNSALLGRSSGFPTLGCIKGCCVDYQTVRVCSRDSSENHLKDKSSHRQLTSICPSPLEKIYIYIYISSSDRIPLTPSISRVYPWPHFVFLILSVALCARNTQKLPPSPFGMETPAVLFGCLIRQVSKWRSPLEC